MQDRAQWSSFDVFRLTALVANDWAPDNALSVAFLHGNTPDNELSIQRAGWTLLKERKVDSLVLVGGDEPYRPPGKPHRPIAFSGGRAWKEWFIQQGVHSRQIIFLPQPELSHTATESKAFALYAREQGLTDAYLVAAPFHLLRCFVSTVSQCLAHYPKLRIWCRPGARQRWFEGGVTSQGHLGGTRIHDFMEMEWARLTKVYRNEFDLLPPQRIFEYLKWRGG